MTSIDKKELHIYASDCCEASMLPIGKEVVIKTSPGVTFYYREKCEKCGKYCHSKLIQVFDSNGIEIKHGDIVECPEMPMDHSSRYHAAEFSDYGLEIRDLGHNNIYMYKINGHYYNIGPYWKHLDKLTDEDLEHYWGTTRAEAHKRHQERDIEER